MMRLKRKTGVRPQTRRSSRHHCKRPRAGTLAKNVNTFFFRQEPSRLLIQTNTYEKMNQGWFLFLSEETK